MARRVADRNIIAGNSTTGASYGIGFWQDADNNIVQGNSIGVGANGTTAMSNRQGITFQGTADRNLIGGTAVGAGNLIAFNSSNGIDVIAPASRTRSSATPIYSNGLLGINLGTAGVTANDAERRRQRRQQPAELPGADVGELERRRHDDCRHAELQRQRQHLPHRVLRQPADRGRRQQR